MLEPKYIKPNDFFFYFEKHLNFKGINKPFHFSETYMKVKGIFNEIHSGFVAVFGVISILGFAYSYCQKYGSKNNNDDINDIDRDHAKINLRNGKNLTIGYNVFNNNNETLDIICILAVILTSIYATHNGINSPAKNYINI